MLGNTSATLLAQAISVDQLWLISEGMDALLEDIERYRDDLARKLLLGQYDDPETVKAHIKDLHKRLGKAYRTLKQCRRQCVEALALMRKYPTGD